MFLHFGLDNEKVKVLYLASLNTNPSTISSCCFWMEASFLVAAKLCRRRCLLPKHSKMFSSASRKPSIRVTISWYKKKTVWKHNKNTELAVSKDSYYRLLHCISFSATRGRKTDKCEYKAVWESYVRMCSENFTNKCTHRFLALQLLHTHSLMSRDKLTRQIFSYLLVCFGIKRNNMSQINKMSA